MSKKIIQINDISGGWQPTFFQSAKNQCSQTLGIDPEAVSTGIGSKISIPTGGIKFNGYSKFSDSNVNSHPIAIITNPKDEKIYSVLSNGRLISYNSSLASETLIGTVTGSSASGAFYYNNYIYILGTGASQDDVSRYGPLNNSPSLTNGVWKGSTLGTQTALTDTTYPTTRNSVKYLNHFGMVHVDNKAYFCDFKDGKGIIHFIRTTKVTDEGDTNDGSTYDAIDLPIGWYPYSIESYGNDIVIAASQNSSSSVKQGKSALFFWDTTSPSFYRIVSLSDPLCTALKYSNGILYCLSGSADGGTRLSRYLGGDSVEGIYLVPDSHPPLQCGVEEYGNRIVFAGFTARQYWITWHSGIFAYGSSNENLSQGLHMIGLSNGLTTTSSNGVITVVKNVQPSVNDVKFVFGGTDGTNYSLEKEDSSASQDTFFISRLFTIGKAFSIKRITLRLPAGISSSSYSVTPSLIIDNGRTTSSGTLINTTNFDGLSSGSSLKHVSSFVTLTEKDFNNGLNTSGANNFALELKCNNASFPAIQLPIEIELEVSDNDYE